jgi:hypothetical protein
LCHIDLYDLDTLLHETCDRLDCILRTGRSERAGRKQTQAHGTHVTSKCESTRSTMQPLGLTDKLPVSDSGLPYLFWFSRQHGVHVVEHDGASRGNQSPPMSPPMRCLRQRHYAICFDT